ncbi:hypothetical protein [Nocardia sp. NPDC049149]|uniref:hypothetical protein n=1 Tax=Nocardia sp. NPDC049149 TaxID=3364315 RepID=UPI003721D09C
MQILAIASPLVGAIGVAVACYVFWYNKRRKRLIVDIGMSKLIAEKVPTLPDQISVTYADAEVTDPFIVNINLTNTGRQDIRAGDFELDRPLAVEVSTPIVAVLQTDQVSLETTHDQNHVLIEPALLVRNRKYTIRLLTDGEPDVIVEKNRLADTDLWGAEEQRVRERRWSRTRGYLTLISGAAFVLLTIAAVVTAESESKSRHHSAEQVKGVTIQSIDDPEIKNRVQASFDRVDQINAIPGFWDSLGSDWKFGAAIALPIFVVLLSVRFRDYRILLAFED